MTDDPVMMMTRQIATLFMIATLAACGADAPPTPPAKAATGLTLSGEARVGVVTEF